VISAICRRSAVFALVAITGGCASGQSVKTVTTTATAPEASASNSSSSQTVSAAAAKPRIKPKTFSGVGTENLGTISVSVDSTLRWSCPSCGSANFQILNSDAGSDIAVNGLDETTGRTVVTAGAYHGVTVNTEGGGWAFTITPGNSTQTSGASPAVPGQTSRVKSTGTSPASASPSVLGALNNYWQAINSDDFHGAYRYLTPGQEGESSWVSSHEAAGIQSATFSGTATDVGGTTATVRVDSLRTQDQASGCQTWSGQYQMVEQGGTWLIAKAEITPSPCAGGSSAPTAPGSTTGTSAADFCTTHTCIPNFPNGNGYIVQCADGEWSHSGGLSGACSDHGGEL
jgi:hypothetical protein